MERLVGPTTAGQVRPLCESTRLGKKLRHPGRRQVFAPVSRRPLWGSCLLAYDRRRSPCISQDNVLNSSLDETFGYDGVNRLISASCANGSTETWTLDSLATWLDSTVNGVSQTRSTDPSNEIGSITQGGTVNNQGYDLAGNMTLIADPNSAQGTLYCTYDAWDRLVEVQAGSSSGAIIAEFSYDGTNRRVSQTDFTASSGPIATYYFYSGQQVVETRQGDPTAAPSTLTPTNQYVWSLRYVDAPILRDSFDGSGNVVPASRIYYLGDANYNVTALVNPSGTVIERYSYDPYGKVTVYDGTWNARPASAVGNTILFAGESMDPETGLYYDRARYYSVTLGNFISQDPAQADINLYRYVGDNPVVSVDPTGLAGRVFPTGVKGTKFFVEWFPGLGTGEIKIITKFGQELAIGKYVVNQQTGEGVLHVVASHGGKMLPGVAQGVLKKILPKLTNQLGRMVGKVGGRWVLTELANGAETGGRLGLARVAGGAAKWGAGMALNVILMFFAMENTCEAAEPQWPYRIEIDPAALGLSQEEIAELESPPMDTLGGNGVPLPSVSPPTHFHPPFPY